MDTTSFLFCELLCVWRLISLNTLLDSYEVPPIIYRYSAACFSVAAVLVMFSGDDIGITYCPGGTPFFPIILDQLELLSMLLFKKDEAAA